MGMGPGNWRTHLAGLGIMIVGVSWIWLISIGVQAMKIGNDLDPRPPGPTYNYWHPSWKGQTALDTLKAIIPNGKGVITYGDTLTDSIRWGV